MPSFAYQTPETLEEALSLLAAQGEEAKLIAGGTALVIMMEQRLLQPAYLIGLRRLRGLSDIRFDAAGLHIGALATHRQVELSAVVRERAPLLAETLRQVATVRIRNMATVGGALAHADPNQDPPPALLALAASVRIASTKGERTVALAEFFRDYYETVLAPDEMITEVLVPPLAPNTKTTYLKFLPRTADDYATVSVAVALRMEDGRCAEARIALGSCGSTPVLARRAAQLLQGGRPTPALLREAAEAVTAEVDPIADFRGSAEYKREMAAVITRRALERALA